MPHVNRQRTKENSIRQVTAFQVCKRRHHASSIREKQFMQQAKKLQKQMDKQIGSLQIQSITFKKRQNSVNQNRQGSSQSYSRQRLDSINRIRDVKKISPIRNQKNKNVRRQSKSPLRKQKQEQEQLEQQENVEESDISPDIKAKYWGHDSKVIQEVSESQMTIQTTEQFTDRKSGSKLSKQNSLKRRLSKQNSIKHKSSEIKQEIQEENEQQDNNKPDPPKYEVNAISGTIVGNTIVLKEEKILLENDIKDDYKEPKINIHLTPLPLEKDNKTNNVSSKDFLNNQVEMSHILSLKVLADVSQCKISPLINNIQPQLKSSQRLETMEYSQVDKISEFNNLKENLSSSKDFLNLDNIPIKEFEEISPLTNFGTSNDLQISQQMVSEQNNVNEAIEQHKNIINQKASIVKTQKIKTNNPYPFNIVDGDESQINRKLIQSDLQKSTHRQLEIELEKSVKLGYSGQIFVQEESKTIEIQNKQEEEKEDKTSNVQKIQKQKLLSVQLPPRSGKIEEKEDQNYSVEEEKQEIDIYIKTPFKLKKMKSFNQKTQQQPEIDKFIGSTIQSRNLGSFKKQFSNKLLISKPQPYPYENYRVKNHLIEKNIKKNIKKRQEEQKFQNPIISKVPKGFTDIQTYTTQNIQTSIYKKSFNRNDESLNDRETNTQNLNQDDQKLLQYEYKSGQEEEEKSEIPKHLKRSSQLGFSDIEDSYLLSYYVPSMSHGYNYPNDSNKFSVIEKLQEYSQQTSMDQTLIYDGQIKINCLLGGGSEAKVYLVKLVEINEIVALKSYELCKKDYNTGLLYRKIQNEFKMVQQIDDEHIIKYFCLYKPRKTHVQNVFEFGVFMEYMAGGSLEQFFKDPESAKFMKATYKIKNYLRQILKGLAHLHKRNIIHRDLKPGNILMTADKKILKISDFGISKQTVNDSITGNTGCVGTPWYMAPEVIDQRPYCTKADIWSFACLAMHLITGQKPFQGSTNIQALIQMSTKEHPLIALPEQHKSFIKKTKYLNNFLLSCFKKNASQRLSASELLEHPFLQDNIEHIRRVIPHTFITEELKKSKEKEKQNQINQRQLIQEQNNI